MVAGAIVVLTVVGFLAYLTRPVGIVHPGTSNSEVQTAAQNAVRMNMGVDVSLKFNAPEEGQIVPMGDRRYMVRGWVLAVTEAGQTRSYMYSVVLAWDANQELFTVHDLNMIPQ